MLFLKKNRPMRLGLDISSASVKLLEFSRKGGRYRIESFAIEPLAPGMANEKNILQAEAVGEAIRRAVARSKTRTRHAVVAVAGTAAFTKVISMPAGLSDDELAEQVMLEAEHYIPYPLDEVNLDFDVIGPVPGDADRVEVLLAASRTENVDVRVGAMELAGLTTDVVDVESNATELALQLIAQGKTGKEFGKLIAIFDIGATMTSLNVADNLRIIYSRDHIFGGRQLTEAIQRRYKLSYDDAGRAKKQGGLPEDYTAQILQPFKESVAQQVSSALQFFYSSSQYRSVDHILLAGGNASIEGIAELIKARTGTDVSIANPFSGMTVAPRIAAQAVIRDAPALLVACGLALRNFD